MAQAEHLANPHSSVPEQAQQQLVAHVGAGADQRLDLLRFQYSGQPPERSGFHQPGANRLPLADVMQERLARSAAAEDEPITLEPLDRSESFVELVEGVNGRENGVDRRLSSPRRSLLERQNA